MPILKDKPNLSDFQKYVVELEKERGFEDRDALQICLGLGEEMGELFNAVRKAQKIPVDLQKTDYSKVNLEEEMADVFIFLCSLANHYQIDLEKAFRDKEEENKKRVWQKVK